MPMQRLIHCSAGGTKGGLRNRMWPGFVASIGNVHPWVRCLNRGARLKSTHAFSIEFGSRKTPRHPCSSRSSAGLLLLLLDRSLRNTRASLNRSQYQ
jgi:hypothetical protein